MTKKVSNIAKHAGMRNENKAEKSFKRQRRYRNIKPLSNEKFYISFSFARPFCTIWKFYARFLEFPSERQRNGNQKRLVFRPMSNVYGVWNSTTLGTTLMHDPQLVCAVTMPPISTSCVCRREAAFWFSWQFWFTFRVLNEIVATLVKNAEM